MTEISQDAQKRAAAEEAARMVRSGMVLGLGTGTTIAHAVRWLAGVMEGGHFHIKAVCTSTATERLAIAHGIPCVPLDAETELDLYIDGADQVNPTGVLVKGGGGALLWEKIVALAARRRVIVVDSTKPVEVLGVTFPVPVEIIRFGHGQTLGRLRAVPGCEPRLRMAPNGEFYTTDEGHYIADCVFPMGIENPREMEAMLKAITGVVDTGLFLGLCDLLLVGTAEGTVERFHF